MKFLSIASLFAAVGLVAAHGYHEGYNPYAKRGLYARDAEAEEDYFADLWERDVESDDLFARDAEPYYYDAELHAREAAEEAEWMDKNLLRRGAIISKVKNFGSKCKAEGGSPAPASKPPKLPHLFQCPMCGCVYLKPSTFIREYTAGGISICYLRGY